MLLLTCGHSNTVTERPLPKSSLQSLVDIATGINVSEAAFMHAYVM